MEREIFTHLPLGKAECIANPHETVQIHVMDKPGPGGANHSYHIIVPCNHGGIPGCTVEHIQFQNGPIAEVGVNGSTVEALLAICEDRLKSFQKGMFACHENEVALQCISAALGILHRRTIDRMDRCVEGKNKK